MHPDFVKPRYGADGFAGIPDRIKTVFERQEYEVVILFLIDAFGWRFFEKHQDAPFLQYLSRHGTVEKITAQFPSTTAAHVTTWHTGQPVGQSGVFEWQYYEPQLDAIIAPLLYSFAGTKDRDTLLPTGIDPRRLYPNQTVYPGLRRLGVSPHIFQHKEFTPSPYSDVVMTGATRHPYKTLAEAMVNLRALLEQEESPLYVGFYFGDVDSILHEYGPNSPQAEAEIESMLHVLQRHFLEPLAGQQKRTRFILTADHGQVEVDPQTTIYLNRDPAFAGVERFFKTDRRGNLLVPAGSCRDMFLYVEDGLLDDAQSFLQARLEGKAAVVKTQDLIEQGYFGPTISDTFLARVGNLVVLPYRYESVWWYEKDRFEQNYYGHHGGLTRQEMEIPLAMCDL
ncbi:MAG: alkaline phosphatase family protein [Chloroflexi bacterium]|nr:alkaline phosphatase family protein [Chloroflexota bacterium]